MQAITVKQLLEAGVHFGHQTRRWNPKMQRYIFGEKSGIYIINLELTLDCLKRAMEFLEKTGREGKEVLFVGTKKQGQEVIRDAAQRSGMPYVNERWLGGMLTNFATIRKSVARLEWIDQMEREGNFRFITKKEVSGLLKEREKLIRYLTGIRQMKRLPGALFIVDTKKEEIALHEAIRLGIPTVALIDTNCDPDLVDYPIPGNDDAIRAIKLFSELAAEAVIQGRNEFLKISAPAPAVAEEKPEEAVLPVPPAVTLPETEAASEVLPIGPALVEDNPEIAPAVKPVVEAIEDKFLQAKLLEEEKLKAKRPVRPKEIKKTKP